MTQTGGATQGASGAGELAGRRAIVTGGSRGIGAGIVARMVAAGAVVVATARNPEGTPAGAVFVEGDLRTEAGARQIAEAALDELGGIDILVNNAGACRGHFGGVGSIPDDEWQDALDSNFLSAVRLTRALLPAMIDQRRGAIVNILSGAALTPPPPFVHYAASKAALMAFSKGLAGEVAPHGVRVNAVTPGQVQTPGLEQIQRQLVDEVGLDPSTVFGSGIPLGRIGESRDIAEAVAFLVSDRAAWITGANLIVDGGETPFM